MRKPVHTHFAKSSWTDYIRGTVYHVISHDRRVADKLLHDYQVEAARGFWFQRRALKAVCCSSCALQDIADIVTRTQVNAIWYTVEGYKLTICS